MQICAVADQNFCRSAREARGSAASSAQRGGHTPPSRANNREPITSMHLEAELNRLEAELAN